MPQVHLVHSRKQAFTIAGKKIWSAPDDASAITAAHLIIEALLHRFLQQKIKNPKKLESVGLHFNQTLSLCKCFRNRLEDEMWLWTTIEVLNQIRNRLAHNIQVIDLPDLIDRLFVTAGKHITIYSPDADPIERDNNKLKYFLLILIGVVRNLQDSKLKV